MLVNCKNEELKKYSKGAYNPDTFIAEIKNRWELTNLQIRMSYLISDLAINGQGVFSIAYSTFMAMFEERFKMSVSKPTVVRFFKLLQNIGVLSINAAKRKNNKQSANIYIIEPIEKEIKNDYPDDYPIDNAIDTPSDNHNIALNKALNIASNKPLKNNFVNKDQIINQLTNEFRLKGLSKQVCLRVLAEVEQNPDVKNFAGYYRVCLENTLYRHDVKHGKITPYERFRERAKGSTVPFYDWLSNADDEELPY